MDVVGTRVSPGKARQHERPAAERRAAERPGAQPPLQRGLGNRIVAHALAARGAAGPGAALPHLERLEAAFGGMSLRGVRAHFGAAARQSAADLGARAYAFGEDVVFREPSPSLRTVAHEAAHVIQQRIGVAAPVGRAGDVHERHADAVAARVVAGESAAPLFAGLTSAGPRRPALQRIGDEDPEAAAQRRAEVAQIKAQLVAALQQGHAALAAEFRRISSRWLVRRSDILRTLDQEISRNDLAGALVTAQLWLDHKGGISSRATAVQGLIAALDEHQHPPPPPPPPQAQAQHAAPNEPVEEEAEPGVFALWQTLEQFESQLRTNDAAVGDPGQFVRRVRNWDAIRSDYKKGALSYQRELGPAKDGTFDFAVARQRHAGMNILLAYRLRETLLKDSDAPKMTHVAPEPSLLQRVHDKLQLGFDWNYGAGTESPTSDIDSNLSGVGTEAAVRGFNEAFRREWGRESGTVFDVNVYARDFLPVRGSAPALNRQFQQDQQGPVHGAPANALGFAAFQNTYPEHAKAVRFEVPLDRDSGAYGEAMRSERVYALVKACMDMPADDWAKFKAAHLEVVVQLDKQKQDGRSRAGALQAVFEQVDAVVEAREKAIRARVEQLRAAPNPNGHDDRDLDMRAQNELYAAGLAEVAELRAQLEHAEDAHRDGVAAKLTDALHRSLIFANESYVTGAAVQHVVLDKQMLSARAKDPLALAQVEPKPKNLKLRLTTERYMHSLHEQLGFAFREFELYAQEPKTALLKASKYIYRLGNAGKHIGADTGAQIVDLVALRAFGKGLLALKVTPAEAEQHDVTFASVLGAYDLDPEDPGLLAKVKARLIAFSANVLATLA